MNANQIKITFTAVMVRLQNMNAELDALEQYVDNLNTDETPVAEPMRRVTEECAIMTNSIATIQRTFPDEDSIPDELIEKLENAAELLDKIVTGVCQKLIYIQKKIVDMYNLPIDVDTTVKNNHSELDRMVEEKCKEDKTRMEAMTEILVEITSSL